jgi:hypothetical protein
LETKYGNAMRANPQSSGTTALCFLPYIKKPSPTDPKSTAQRSDDVFTEFSMSPNDQTQRRGRIAKGSSDSLTESAAAPCDVARHRTISSPWRCLSLPYTEAAHHSSPSSSRLNPRICGHSVLLVRLRLRYPVRSLPLLPALSG